MQAAALAGEGQELRAVLARQHPQADPGAGGRRRPGSISAGRTVSSGRRRSTGRFMHGSIKAHGADYECARDGARSRSTRAPRCGRSSGGVERWARELCARLPYRIRAPPPAARRTAPATRGSSSALPALSARADVLLCPANLAPVAARNVVVILHDAAPLRHPGWYSGALRRLAARAAAADRAPRPARDHGLALLARRAEGAAGRRGGGRLRRRRRALLRRGAGRGASGPTCCASRRTPRARTSARSSRRRARRSRARASTWSSPAATARSSPPRRASTA